MRYDLNHSRDMTSPQPRDEVMGPPEPAKPSADGQALKTRRVVKAGRPKPAKPSEQVERLTPEQFEQYVARVAELERHGKITSKTAQKLRTALRRQVPRRYTRKL